MYLKIKSKGVGVMAKDPLGQHHPLSAPWCDASATLGFSFLLACTLVAQVAASPSLPWGTWGDFLASTLGLVQLWLS